MIFSDIDYRTGTDTDGYAYCTINGQLFYSKNKNAFEIKHTKNDEFLIMFIK